MDRVPIELFQGVPAVLAAVREGSATRAASALGTTAATVLRRVDAMEAALGVRLFERLPTGLVGTPALAAVLPWAERCASAVHGMRRDTAGLDLEPSGLVRLAVPPTIASHLLVPELHRLATRWPRITLEFATDTRLVDLGRQEADLAIRSVRPIDGDLVARKLGDYQLIIACAPSLIEQEGASALTLPWVTWDRSMAHIPEARWMGAALPGARIAMMASELTTLLRAARAGVGAILVAEAVAAREGGLVRVASEELEMPVGSLWVLAHRALRHVPRVAAVWEWIEECFSDEALAKELLLSPAA